MLRVVTGSYHPDLETALVEEVRSLKSSDPFAPLAIVVPSDPLKRRLLDLLCLEQGLALLDVRILTFHQLALQLADERRASPGGRDGTTGLEEVSNLFFERLLRSIAGRRLPALRGLDLPALQPGAWPVLWTAVRDLKDATVDPAVALRAAAEGLFDPHETAMLQSLFTLHAAVRETGRALGVGSADDVAASVTGWAAASPWLARQVRVCYYGFYDLTQVQLSLFEAVVRAVPATLYFPLGRGDAYAFARRFFERHLEPLTGSAPAVTVPPTGRDQPAAVRTMSAVGPDAELAAACKEILTLVETNGYRFDEIGVVARTLEPYRPSLRRTFDQHRIPFVTTATAPLVEEPAAKAVLQLAALPHTNLFRTPVLDVLTSPFFRCADAADRSVEPRPDLWPAVVRALGITRGEQEWRRLASAGAVTTCLGGGGWDEDDGRGGAGAPDVDAPQVALLWRLASRLVEGCRRLPRQGTMGELTDAFGSLVREQLAVPGLAEGGDGGEASHAVGSAIGSVLRELRRLDRLGETLDWEEWARLFGEAMERAALPVEPWAHGGVRVLDAMAARGVPFRALFLLGLNEAVFPRTIREDAFLRDRARRVLGETLGYKIDEKLAGYEEERLLFEMLVRSASERLHLSWQRADADGRPLAVSSYLDPWLRTGEGPSREPDVAVPRRLTDRAALPLFAPPILTREELAVGLVLRDRDPSALLEAAGRGPLLFRNGAAASREMEGTAGGLGPYDGLTGPLDRHWEKVTERGLAPTPLEQYARCPFQYFSAQVLALEPVRDRPDAEVSPRALGDLCHAVLYRCYRNWCGAGWPQRELPGGKLQADVLEATDEAFAEHAREHGAGYPLLWQIAKETVAGLVQAAALADERECRASGFRPDSFEVEAEGTLERVGGSGLKGLRVRGRLDRVDRRETPPGLRIVDYKYRHGGRMKDEDRNLVLSAARGMRLQPPLYAVMAPAGAKGRAGALQPESVELVFLARRWETKVERASFDPAEWTGPAGRTIAQTVRTLVDGIRDGRYFVLPDGYCDHCEFAGACRRFHGPTWWRAHTAPAARTLRGLRRQKVSDE